MKNTNLRTLGILSILSAFSFLLYSCAVNGTAIGYDDIYADDTQIAFEEQSENHAYRTPYQDKRYKHSQQDYREVYGQNANADTSSFDMDDYYDYAYTARLHRFHSPSPIYNNYYDDFYTDYYWYDTDPLYWGTSIYLGYRWWWPTYGYTWGWGWRPYYYGWYGSWYGWYDYAWGYPYYDWGWHHGYHHGWRDYAWGHNRNTNYYRPDHNGGRLARNTRTGSSGPGYRGITQKPLTTAQSNTIRRSNRLNKPANRLTTPQRNINRTNTTSGISGKNLQTPQNTTRRSLSNANNSTRRTYTPPAQRQQRNNNTYRNTPQRRSITPSRNNSNSSRSLSSPQRSSSSRSSFGGGSRSTGSSHSGGSVSRGRR